LRGMGWLGAQEFAREIMREMGNFSEGACDGEGGGLVYRKNAAAGVES
jgi:hypothetical protein